MNRKSIYRIALLFGLLIMFMPIVFSLAQIENQNDAMSTQEEFTRLRRIFIFTRDQVGNIASVDVYHMQLKQGNEYYFYSKINIEAGTFVLIVDGPGGSDHIGGGIWDASTPKSDRKISYLFTATETGDHIITIGTAIAVDGGNYSLYVNRSGFAGYWWMILVGIVVLFAILIVPLFLFRKKKKKKRKRKRK